MFDRNESITIVKPTESQKVLYRCFCETIQTPCAKVRTNRCKKGTSAPFRIYSAVPKSITHGLTVLCEG